MQTLGLTPMTPSLRLGDLPFQPTVETSALQTFAIAGDCDVLQSQVDADGLLGSDGRLSRVFDRQTQPPVSYGILREAALPPFNSLQTVRFEDPERLSAEAQRLTSTLQTRGLQRYPPQRTSRTSADAPT